MTEDDQIDVQTLRVGSDLIDGVAARQIAFRGDAARLEPLDRLIQHSLVAPHRIVDDASMSRGARHQERVVNAARNYRQYVRVRIQQDGEFSAASQSTPTRVRTVIAEKYPLEHRRCSDCRPAQIYRVYTEDNDGIFDVKSDPTPRQAFATNVRVAVRIMRHASDHLAAAKRAAQPCVHCRRPTTATPRPTD